MALFVLSRCFLDFSVGVWTFSYDWVISLPFLLGMQHLHGIKNFTVSSPWTWLWKLDFESRSNHIIKIWINIVSNRWLKLLVIHSHIGHKQRYKVSIRWDLYLKLYCRYLYTRPCMINHIWGLKQLWLQVNGHAWFHLQRLRWPVRNGEGAKNSKWKYVSSGIRTHTRQSTTGKLQRLRPLGHAG